MNFSNPKDKEQKGFLYITTEISNVHYPEGIGQLLIDGNFISPEDYDRLLMFKYLLEKTPLDKRNKINEYDDVLVILYRSFNVEEFKGQIQEIQGHLVNDRPMDMAIEETEASEYMIFNTGLAVRVLNMEFKDRRCVITYKGVAPFMCDSITNKTVTGEVNFWEQINTTNPDRLNEEAFNIIQNNLAYGDLDINTALNSDLWSRTEELQSMGILKTTKTFVENPVTREKEYLRKMIFNDKPFLVYSDPENQSVFWTFEDYKALIEKYIKQEKLVTEDKVYLAKLLTLFGVLSDAAIPPIFKYKLLHDFNLESIKEIEKILSHAMSMMLENEVSLDKVIANRFQNQQEEYMIKEKYKILKETVEGNQEKDEYQKTIANKTLSKRYPSFIQKSITQEEQRLSEMMSSSPDANIARTYIELLKKLPWRLTQKEKIDIHTVQEILDKHHYGLDDVKERIIEHIALLIKAKRFAKETELKRYSVDDQTEIDMNLFKEKEEDTYQFNNTPIITLIGPPGTGKTSLTKAIAEALGRKLIKVSLGGVHDESEIRGHRRTYVGAMPGKIIKAIMKAKVSNPVILLDEIDKMAIGSTNKGDPASAMLEVLDPEQNTKFQDNYLEHEYDLSKVIFIATANYYEGIPEALLDRVELIEVPAYTLSEKLQIARTHLIPKVIEQAYISAELFQISQENLEFLISRYTREAGVRGLKKVLDKIARKISKQTEFDPNIKEFIITPEILEEFLGPAIFNQDPKDETYVPGVVNGLAYTSYGGSTLQIEVDIYPGKGELKLTGSLKDVMKESALIALSYVRGNAKEFDIEDFEFDDKTIHIHVPEGATPKDGPSAGVTFTTAILSAIKNISIPTNYAMTGEITLRGRVLEIGGLKEKSFAAYQNEIKYVFIPKNNQRNLQKVPQEVKEKLTYIPVENYQDIYEVLFENKKPKQTIITK